MEIPFCDRLIESSEPLECRRRNLLRKRMLSVVVLGDRGARSRRLDKAEPDSWPSISDLGWLTSASSLSASSLLAA